MAADHSALDATGAIEPVSVNHRTTLMVRVFGWMIISALAVFIINNYLTFWQGWPGAAAALGIGKHQQATGAAAGLAWTQFGAYLVGLILAAVYVSRTYDMTLRQDNERITAINAFIIRCAFFAVLYVGIADEIISFMRVEDFLPAVFGDNLAVDLGRSQFRGPWVHLPLSALGILTACFTRTLGFTWLSLLVVGAELLIVISRFIFSYEQVFMGDLVRFWYAALFLFASAHTLIEEGHVRVDVFYAAFEPKRKGVVNAFGSIILGVTLCWVILVVGMGTKNSVINSPMLVWETTQTGFSMYVKYMMAGFLGVFAITMMIQFVGYMMDAVADVRGEPGGRSRDSGSSH